MTGGNDMKTLHITIKLLLLLLAAAIYGCGGGLTAVDEPEDYDSLIESGWAKYNDHNYTAACKLFAKAKVIDNMRPEAFIGCGWTKLRLQQPDSSVVAFTTAFKYITTLNDSVDAITGLSGAYLARGDNQKVVSLFKTTLVSSYDNSFPLEKHDFSLEYDHLEIVQAMALYRLGYYSATQKADPDNATYHLNKVTTYTYDDPPGLMKKIIEHLDLLSGGYYL